MLGSAHVANEKWEDAELEFALATKSAGAACPFRFRVTASSGGTWSDMSDTNKALVVLILAIVVVGFGITLGGIVMAGAIAFGLGAKDLAKDYLERGLSVRTREGAPDDLRHL